MASVWTSWRIILLAIFLFSALFIVFTQGINFGIDFHGGTQFQIHFDEKIKSPADLERVTNVIEQRLNWTGLKDVKVFTLGDEFVVAQLAETDPKTIDRTEQLLKKQGRFEVFIDGNLMFQGEEVVAVDQSAGAVPAFQPGATYTGWNLPFTLKSTAALRFRDLSFHKCTLVGMGSDNPEGEYTCAVTYFFIDRPKNSILLFSQQQFDADNDLFQFGNRLANIPDSTDMDAVLKNTQAPYLVIDFNSGFTPVQLAELNSLKALNSTIIAPEGLPENLATQLTDIGFKLKLEPVQADVPWLYRVSGLRNIVRLQPSITGNQPYVDSKDQAPVLSDLIITGSSVSVEGAQRERLETKALLQSGSLPVSVESITRESVSPLLGQNFLFNAGIMGLVAILVVSLIIFIRYRLLKISIPIVIISIMEIFISLVFTSLFGNITLESIAAITAAVGTGVNDQIVITDELLAGSQKLEVVSISTRVKRAFFIVIGAAATILAVMVPVLIFGSVLVKLVGFAIASIVAVLVGVLITRPAFSVIASHLLSQ